MDHDGDQEHESERPGIWIRYAASAVLAAAVAAIVVAAIAAGGGDTDGSTQPTAARPLLQAGPPPWPAETTNLQARLASLDLPAEGEAFHAHAVLRVFVNGTQVKVPADIGIDLASGTFSSLHTHDTSGEIHMEATEPYAFTLDHLFVVWGVELGPGRIGGLRSTGDKKLEVFANGTPVDPRTYVLKDKDKVIVAYGEPGSAPSAFPAAWHK